MLQNMPEMLSLSMKNINVFWERITRPSYFLHKSLTCWGNGTEGKIWVSEAPQKRFEWENVIFFAAWFMMIPSYMFLNSFCGWLHGRNKSLPERKSLSNFFGNMHPLAPPTQNRVCPVFLPPNHTFILPPVRKLRVYHNLQLLTLNI